MYNRPRRVRRSAGLLACFLLAGCGYVGEPLPPALNIPERITDLRALQSGPNIVVQFTVPALTTEALPMPEASVDLRVGPMPPGEFNVASWSAAAKHYPADSVKAGNYRVEIPASNWTDQEVVIAVRAQHPRGRASEWSNLEVLRVLPPVATPRELRAEATAAGVRLRWHAADPDLAFRIYRRDTSTNETGLIGSATNVEFLDSGVEYGKTYEYSVQAVAKAGEREAESLISAPVQVAREDRFAPTVPSGLTAVAGTGSIELAWTPSPEPDIAGYRIYRAIGSGELTRIAELVPVPSFSDRAVESGKSYRYAVTSVDQLGNESARSEPLEVSAQ